MTMKTYKEVLDFWFDPNHVLLQFAENEDFDERIREEFLKTWELAKEGLLVSWRENIWGRLAEIIVLDQFSRNLFRRDIRTYTQDKMAIALAQEALALESYEELSKDEKKFILLPFMHSESLALHEWAYPHYLALDDPATLYFEDKHKAILERFGRYPYQNQDLGRESTEEEKQFLAEKQGDYFDASGVPEY